MMRFRVFVCLVVVLAWVALSSAGGAQNLVVNGSFDTGDFTGWTQQAANNGGVYFPELLNDCCGSATSRSARVYTLAPTAVAISQCIPLPQAGPFDLGVKGNFGGGGGIGFSGQIYSASAQLLWYAGANCSGTSLVLRPWRPSPSRPPPTNAGSGYPS